MSSFLRVYLTSCFVSLSSLLPFVLCVYCFLRSCRVCPYFQCLHVCLQSLQLIFDLCYLLLCHVCLFACLWPCSILGLKPISHSVWAIGLSLLCVGPQAHPHFILSLKPILFNLLCVCMLCLCLCASYVVVFILFVIFCDHMFVWCLMRIFCVFLFFFLCESSVFMFCIFHVCMNLVCLFLQTLCGCVFV